MPFEPLEFTVPKLTKLLKIQSKMGFRSV